MPSSRLSWREIEVIAENFLRSPREASSLLPGIFGIVEKPDMQMKTPGIELLGRDVEPGPAEPVVQSWADAFARFTEIDNILHQKGSVRSPMKSLEEIILLGS
jgi:hypothetical protein